jgi:hypothetical protein
MKAPPEVSPPPAIVAVKDCLIGQLIPHQTWQSVLDSLIKAKAWHYLGTRDPVITRTQMPKWWLRGMPDDKKWSDRDAALQVVFLNSFMLVFAEKKTTTAAEKKDLADSYRKRAKQLRDAATWLIECPQNTGEVEEHVEAIKHAATWYEMEAGQIVDKEFLAHIGDDVLVVSRHRGSPRVRAYCLQLAEVTRLLYGDVLYGTVIAITHAALGTKVSIENLRYWCKKDVNKKP